MSEESVRDIPGVGSTRVAQFREAGYSSVADIADASVGELIEFRSISQPVAHCIQEGAKEMRGDNGTVQARIAAEYDVDRDKVASAFGDMARLGVAVSEIESFLIEFFTTSNTSSIVNFDEYGLQIRFFLKRAGFQTIEDVSEASLDDLAETKYVGRKRGKKIKGAASESLSDSFLQTPSIHDEEIETQIEHMSTPYYHVGVESPDFISWNDSAHIFAPRRFNPAMKDTTPEYQQIIKYAKEGEGSLKSKFVAELVEMCELVNRASSMEFDCFTVIPSHTGELSAALVQLAVETGNRCGAYYKKLVASEEGSKRQRTRSRRQRWERQDELLSVSCSLSGHSILVIDDISTTGSTLTTATHYLHEAGASDVVSFCLGLTYGQESTVTNLNGITAFDNIEGFNT